MLGFLFPNKLTIIIFNDINKPVPLRIPKQKQSTTSSTMPKLIIDFGAHVPPAGFFLASLLSIVLGPEDQHPDREFECKGNGLFELTDKNAHLELVQEVFAQRSWHDSRFHRNRNDPNLQMAIGDLGDEFDTTAKQILGRVKKIEIAA